MDEVFFYFGIRQFPPKNTSPTKKTDGIRTESGLSNSIFIRLKNIVIPGFCGVFIENKSSYEFRFLDKVGRKWMWKAGVNSDRLQRGKIFEYIVNKFVFR